MVPIRDLRTVVHGEGELDGLGVTLDHPGHGMGGFVEQDHDRGTDHQRETAAEDDRLPRSLIHAGILAHREVVWNGSFRNPCPTPGEDAVAPPYRTSGGRGPAED